MKSCPKCAKTYPDEYNICPQDGQTLVHMAKKAAGDIFDHLIDDKYQVLRLIGRGGMGAVYEAIHTTMQRRVAIKILNPELVSNPAAMERFRREALASGRLKHPNAITIYDYGTTDRGEAFIVMEYLEGCSLNQEIQTVGPMDSTRVAWILAQACDAVHAAHQEGIIHRDLKPANIMLEKLRTGEVVKVLDFGIAKLATSSNPNIMNLTGTGIIGTPQYMSPEQCQAHNVDARTDVYSLGIIAYEMLTGTLPFDGPAPLAIVIAQVKQPPPKLRDRRAEIPEAAEAVVMRALEKDPAKRQQTAEEFARDFRSLIRQLSTSRSTSQATGNISPPRESRPGGLTSHAVPPIKGDRITALETIIRPGVPAAGAATVTPGTEYSGALPLSNLPPRPVRELVSLPTYASMERFVGRTQELSLLRAAWQRIQQGRGGRPILIFGEPGIGKTRLADEMRERLEDMADGAPPLILTGKFFEFGGAAPYQVLIESLRQPCLSLFGREIHEDAPLSPEDERFVSKAFLKTLASDDYMSVVGGAHGSGDQEKFRIFDQLVRLYTLMARRRGVLVFFDDTQWVDELTLEFLAHLNRSLLNERLLIVVAMRSMVLSIDTHPLRRWMRQLDETGGFEQIMLAPLSNSEVRGMVEGMLGNQIQLPANVIQLLAEETKGNPYYVGEIVRQMISNGQIKRDKTAGWVCADISEFDLPDSIAALVATHISRLEDKVADTLAQAAVIGEDFTFDLLQHVTELREEELLDAIESGLKTGILREVVASGEDRYVFAQSTIHRVMYKRISRRRRKKLHGRVAEKLEKTAASVSASSAAITKDRMAGDLAYHYFRAEDWSQALRYAMEAGYIKWKTFAIGEASKYYGWVAQALQQLRAMEEAGVNNRSMDIEVQKPDVLVQFHLNYGSLLMECSQVQEAEHQLQLALKLCQETKLSALGRTQAALARLCNLSGLSEQALEFGRAALDRLQEHEDREGVVAALHTIGEAHLAQGQHATALQYLEEALKMADDAGNRAGKAAVLSSLGKMYYQQGRYAQALTQTEQALAITRLLGNGFDERRNLSLLGNIHLYLGQLEEAESYYQSALKMACALGHRLGEAAGLNHIGDVLTRQERFGEALESYQQAIRIARDIGNRLAEGQYLLNIGAVQRERGEYKAALAALEQALSIAWETSSHHVEAETLCIIGDTYRRLNLFEESESAFVRAGTLVQELEIPEVAWRTHYFWAISEQAQNKNDRAIKHLQEAITIIERIKAEIPEDDDSSESFKHNKQPVYDLLAKLGGASTSPEVVSKGLSQRMVTPAPITMIMPPKATAPVKDLEFELETDETAWRDESESKGNRSAPVRKGARGSSARLYVEDGGGRTPGREGKAVLSETGEFVDEAFNPVSEVLSDLIEFANQLEMDGLFEVGEVQESSALSRGEAASEKKKEPKKVKPKDPPPPPPPPPPTVVAELKPEIKVEKPAPPVQSFEPLATSPPATPTSHTPLSSVTLASSASSLETNWQQMLQSARAAGDRGAEKRALTLMGSSLHSQGHTARARDNYQQALAIGKETQSRQGEAALLNNIGETFRQEGRYADALAYYRLALRSAREFRDDRASEIALVNAGLMYMRLGQIKEALSMLNQAQASNEVTQDQEMRAEALQALGEVYWIQKEYAKALDSCQEALKLAQDVGNSDLEWRAQWVIGRCRWLRQEKPLAQAALQASLAAIDRRFSELAGEDLRRRLLSERQEISSLHEEWQRESGIRG
ncbi:MAG TPA: tetratricopeptide repeat protein [Acidobacteriota bacterium]|nr:tetratricopeptide repeat protein [Acidobacteriota bacterium]HNB69616.1 tetratricopeptide repeat protein [Acidobacteriota bacterium]HNH81279.1 tetratricopeptide repeat protein [Acidobacteriota bacterium]